MKSSRKIPWYKKADSLYYVCSLIALGFAALQFIASHLSDYFPIAKKVNVQAFEGTLQREHTRLWIISLAQVIVVTVLLLITYFEVRHKTAIGKSTAQVKLVMNSSLKRLANGVFWVSTSWIMLYSWFTYFWASHPVEIFGLEGRIAFWIIADIFHVASAFFFFYCFSALEHPSKLKGDADAAERRRRNNIYVLLLSSGFLLFSIVGRCGYWDMEKLGPILLSFWIALSMQYFFGKLDSFALKVPRLLLAPLYMYVLVQMIWASISGYLSVKETFFILVFTLIFKIYFLFLFHRWIRFDGFNRYFKKCSTRAELPGRR